MNYSSLSNGQLLDRTEAIADRMRGGTATRADKTEYDALEAEQNRRDEAWRNDRPREERNGARASASDMRDVAGLSGFSYSNRAATGEERAFTEYLRTGRAGEELRAQSEGSQTAGGYSVPQSFWNRLSVALKAFGGIAQDFQQVSTPDGRTMPWPTNNPTGTSASYITENTQITNTDYVFGQGMMFSWTLAELILASIQLIQDSAIDVDGFVADRIGEAIGRKVATEVISGAGSGSKALTGIMPSMTAFGATTSNTSGGYYTLGSATAVSLFSGSSTELTANVLAPQTCVSMLEALDPAYYDGAAWYMNQAQAWGMRSVVDSNKRPLINLDAAFEDGAIGTLFGFPVKVVQDIPNLSASTIGGPVLGNMSHAMVLRTVADGTSVMRLTERYADYLQVGFLGHVRLDSQPNDLRACVTVQCAST